MAYRSVSGDRRQVVRELEVMTGKRAEYTRMPRMAYLIEGIAVEVDGRITLEEGARMDLVERLLSMGVIASTEGGEETSTEEAEETSIEGGGETSTEEAEETSTEGGEETSTEEVEETSTEDAEDSRDKAEATSTEEVESQEEEAEATSTEEVEATFTEAEESQAEESQEEEEESQAEESQEEAESQEEEDIVETYRRGLDLTEERVPTAVSFSFPLAAHRPDSIINLVATIYTRGKLISKATGGVFSATADLIECLQPSGGHTTIEAVLGIIREKGGLAGLSFTEDKVVFDGFSATDDEDCKKAWKALSEAINRTAIMQIHVRAKDIDDTNEKFAFRTWLTRLGMNGPELKKERLLLYKNLSGHTAFRTALDAEKWKARQAARRGNSEGQAGGEEGKQ